MVIQRKAKTILVETTEGWNTSITTMDRNNTDSVIIKSNTKIRHDNENTEEMLKLYDLLAEEFNENVGEIKKRYFILDEKSIVNINISRNNLLIEKRTKLYMEIVLSLVDIYNFSNVEETLTDFAKECVELADCMFTEKGFDIY